MHGQGTAMDRTTCDTKSPQPPAAALHGTSCLESRFARMPIMCPASQQVLHVAQVLVAIVPCRVCWRKSRHIIRHSCLTVLA